MKRPLFLFLILLSGIHISYAQSALKLGVSYQMSNLGSNTVHHFGVDIPSYYKFRSNTKYFEAGLSSFSIGSDNNSFSYKYSRVDISPFAEWGRVLGDPEKKWRFTGGARVIWGNNFDKRKPNSNTDFTYSTFVTGVTVALVPGVLCKVGERLWVDFRVPLQVITIFSEFTSTQNPMIPVREQRNYGLEGELLPQNYGLGMGLIYRLGD